ncbi:M23 family metallopeptidase [Conexibacter sp. SYSU D00693]|uniref:M23 family metallopeptidase n=1 Tax=Conexibacter sp. SYSU D00693 TaxID=2812560 RepID=UPI00196B4D5E|nr:M23 family metallopeptidase [Conexibacter sp. SYSU D00693]
MAPSAPSGVVCRTACAGLDRARRGSTVRLTGESVAGIRKVVFLGGRGERDDTSAPVAGSGPGFVDAVVPARARTGPVRFVSAEGLRGRVSRVRLRVVAAAPKSLPRLQARVDRKRVFIGGADKASVSFFVGGSTPAAVAVAVVPFGQSAPIASWTPGILAPGTVGSVDWDGTVDGKPAPEGRYDFFVMAAGGDGGAAPRSAASSAASGSGPRARSGFYLVSHRFPIAGPHTYGEGIARFGAARNGHSHEGQDVFAACGTPLVASTGGTVKHVAFQGNAGNYVVIAGTDGYDHAYMHMRRPSPLKKGAPVRTGDPVGEVGDTGDADGCHLHYEMWTAPGWYTGGKPVDPLAFLKSWDA